MLACLQALVLSFHMSCTGDGYYPGELAAKTQPRMVPQKTLLSGTVTTTIPLAALPIQINPEISVQSLTLNCTSRAEYFWPDTNPQKLWTSYGSTSLLMRFEILHLFMLAETFTHF